MDWVLERVLKGEDPNQHPDSARRCANWSRVVDLLWQRKWLQEGTLKLTVEGRQYIERQLIKYRNDLPASQPFRVHVAPIGSGSKVVKDPEIFEKLSWTMRKVMGLEMEAAAIGAVAHLHQVPYMIVMKAVMDFGDSTKSDHFKPFAARASAECLIAFLRENLPGRQGTSEAVLNPPQPHAEALRRTQVFISYCQQDERWLERLETHLRPLVRSGALDVWSDRRIAPGLKRGEELEKALARAKVAVLLVSPDYLASDFINQQVLNPLLKAAEKEEASIFWLPIKHSLYQYTELRDYQPLVDPSKPLSMRHHAYVDEALVDVVRKIMERLQS
jgi:hypothetical protein